jgi:acyl transferase domain-containing protein
MSGGIAIVGIGLRYPDADTPDELWENVLSGRRAFGRRPAPGAHSDGLVLEVTAKALADAGFRGGHGLPRATGVVVGSSLTEPAATPVASRICDHFALTGGQYTVDCGREPALLSIATAAKALAAGDLDVAVAGTAGSSVGLLVLMRESDAVARSHRSYASIAGWGSVADAYRMAGYGVDTVSYFEGEATVPGVAFGSIEGNFGHAGVGVAGLIKAALAVHHQVVPPGTGRPATGDVPARAELFPAGKEIRAGVSTTAAGGAMYIALRQPPGLQRRTGLSRRTEAMVAGRQDCELLLLDSPDLPGLHNLVAELLDMVPKLTFAELADLAGTLALELSGHRTRAAVVASSPEDAERKLATLLGLLDAGEGEVFLPGDGIFAAGRPGVPAIAYLFPGNGSGALGAIQRRFSVPESVIRAAEVERTSVVAGSVAALRVLHSLGIDANIALGHGLGELTALAWAGAMDGTQLLSLAAGGGHARERLAELNLRPLTRPVVSTARTDVLALPMRFLEAAAKAAGRVDLAVEIGPGRELSVLLSQISPATPLLAVDTGSQSLAALLGVAGAAFALGVAVDTTPLFADRVLRLLKLNEEFALRGFASVKLAEGLENPARTGG